MSYTAEVLRAAQKKPEEHKDLMVHLAGYSAYFVVQDPRVQEDVIARTEHKALVWSALVPPGALSTAQAQEHGG